MKRVIKILKKCFLMDAGANSIDAGNNTGWVFSASPNIILSTSNTTDNNDVNLININVINIASSNIIDENDFSNFLANIINFATISYTDQNDVNLTQCRVYIALISNSIDSNDLSISQSTITNFAISNTLDANDVSLLIATELGIDYFFLTTNTYLIAMVVNQHAI